MLHLDPMRSAALREAQEHHENLVRAIHVIKQLKGIRPVQAYKTLELAHDLLKDFFVVADLSVDQYNVTIEGTGTQWKKETGRI